MSRIETIGDATLYLGDCREFLPMLRVDAVVTDPPYGLGHLWTGGRARTKSKWRLCDGGVAVPWDAATADIPPIAADDAIIWGGNYYSLPPARGWLIWDKIVREFSSGHAELAWTTIDQPIRTFNYAHAQLASEGKLHPTQKPLPLIDWCLGFLPRAQTVLDPFMGSGTTGVACLNRDRRFIGIEIDPEYFDMACRRIEKAHRQPRLFQEPPPKPVQEVLL